MERTVAIYDVKFSTSMKLHLLLLRSFKPDIILKAISRFHD